MTSFAQKKYKDALPISTINKIRNILGDLNILTIERAWHNSAEEFYSVNLNITNTNLFTNGKGTTYEYALASAYGEMMERLQNFAPFRLSMDLSREAVEFGGFYYAPDEKQLSIEEFLNSQEDWAESMLSNLNPNIDCHNLLQTWLGVTYEDLPTDFIGVPYLNITNNKISYIPVKMACKMYMSNGMCAGNTPEEALIQGISEILERKANKAIIEENITPPTIPQTYIQKYPRIEKMIKQIEENGFQIILKDCSLNMGFPVVGLILIHKHSQQYFWKFGAHPIFEIAAERTLTELLQGQNIQKMKGLSEYCYKTEIANMERNIMGILVNGIGKYPTHTFNPESSYNFKEFTPLNAQNNKIILKHLVKLLKEKGFNIFVRDVSFLGFPSYHIIIPGLSEIEKFDNINSFKEYSNFNIMKKYIRNLDNLSDKESEELIRLLESSDYNSQASIIQMLSLPLNKMIPWYYSNIDLFLTTLHYKKCNFSEAYKAFQRFLQDNPPQKQTNNYYKCVRDYLGTKVDGLDEKEALQKLKVFYPIELLQGVQKEFKTPKNIFNLYDTFSCFNCKKCKFLKFCEYPKVEHVYITLKEKYSHANINQADLLSNLILNNEDGPPV